MSSANIAPKRYLCIARTRTAPYDAVKHELATRFAGMDGATQRKAGRKFAREIGMFIRESDKSLH